MKRAKKHRCKEGLARRKVQTSFSYVFEEEKRTILRVANCKHLFRTFLRAKNVRFHALHFSRKKHQSMKGILSVQQVIEPNIIALIFARKNLASNIVSPALYVK